MALNYYNEIDPFCAQWLQNLMDAGHIAQGDIDTRSIEDVRPSDLTGYVQCHFFAGLGGWAYALDLAGWPRDRPVWTGSCPCQPFSAAGKGDGFADKRHLWPAWHHLINQCQPAVVFGEQVAAAIGKQWLDGVCADLEGSGYAIGSGVLPACAVGAPHRRDRLWFVADSNDLHAQGFERGCVDSRGRPLTSERPTGSFSARDSAVADTGCGRFGQPCEREIEFARRAQAFGASGSALANTDVFSCGQGRAHVGGINQGGGSQSRTGFWCGSSGSNVVDADSDGRIAGITASSAARHWDTSEPAGSSTIIGHDGKARRVEPSIRLLAHGIPGRVGQLRALGNAIVPQVAAEFVAAYMDVQQLEQLAA